MKYKIEIELDVQKSWASIEDFELEIQKFNQANKGVLKAEIKSVEEAQEE
jgi:flagellar biosynthesis/type III secretory pathway chaperone